MACVWEVRNLGWLVHAFQVMTRKMGKHMDLRDQGGDLELERAHPHWGWRGWANSPTGRDTGGGGGAIGVCQVLQS